MLARNRERGKGPKPSSSPSPYNTDINSEEGNAGESEEQSMRGNGADQSPKRNRLSIDVRKRIVELYATFQTVSYIRDAIKAEFGLSLSLNTIQHYDPERSRFLSPKLRAHCEEIRQRYITETARIAVAHKAHRLRTIQGIIDKATTAKDFNAALKGVELAAKEMGELSSSTTIKHEGTIAHVHGTVEDAKAELAMRLQGLIDSGALPSTPPVDAVALPAPEPTPLPPS